MGDNMRDKYIKNPLHRTRTARNNRGGEERENVRVAISAPVSMGENERD